MAPARAPLAWLLTAACVSLPLLARGDGPLLHEYVPSVEANEAMLLVTSRQAEPAAIVYGDEVLPAPRAEQAQGMPAMSALAGDGQQQELPGRRSPSFHPDRQTELESTLDYHAAFTPAIAPFKRVTSLDAVALSDDGITPYLRVRDTRRRLVPIEGVEAPAPDARPRDRFWGEARLDFSGGREVPLPSVSPESRILTLRTEPEVALRIERDRADNFVAVLQGKAPTKPVFVAFLTDAPSSYFGVEIPRVPMDALAQELQDLEPSIRARALGFAAQLGIAPGDDLRKALHALTGHFRAFEESATPPRNSGDIYLDLVRAKKGVCRHRAYGFVVTAHALGIVARFVQNEAHSWVEVKLPEQGFMRIDLGGAAHGLNAHGTAERPHYQPVEPDRLPRPPAYESSYSQAAAAGTGTQSRPELDELAGRWVEPSSAEAAAVSAEASYHAAPGEQSAMTDTDMEAGGRVPVRLTLDRRRATVLRGTQLQVSGRLQDATEQGVAGLRIEVSLAWPEHRTRMLLGVTVSDEQGYFRSAFGVPLDLEVGDYQLVVLTPGDEHHLPAIAQ